MAQIEEEHRLAATLAAEMEKQGAVDNEKGSAIQFSIE